jgi:hypothetical protein
MLVVALASAAGQTIDVDITPSHIRKTIIPNQALGAGIDRIPQKTIDTAFT